jgi:hypothetical protein
MPDIGYRPAADRERINVWDGQLLPEAMYLQYVVNESIIGCVAMLGLRDRSRDIAKAKRTLLR